MKRVCLIVDHPDRDLDGLVLLARELGKRGVEAILVPMYQRYEVLMLRPDMVVVNYARYANQELLELCQMIGIAVAVLDTEGGVVQDVGKFAEKVLPYVHAVDLYFTWGTAQRKALQARLSNGKPKILTTGCPRYDFASERWSAAVRNAGAAAAPMVLVNTNFPVANPRFQSAEKEAEDLIHRMHYDADWVHAVVRQAGEAHRAMIETTVALAARLPAVSFVLRPHPFENADNYCRAFAGARNIAVMQEGTIFEWVKRASVVLHHHCSTAIEAVMMGREPIMVDWLDTPLLVQPGSAAVSLKAHSLEAAAELVQSILAGKPVPVPPEVVEARRRIINEFFFANDGGAAERIAQNIAEFLLARSARAETGDYLRELIRKQSRRRNVQLLLAAALGGRAYNAALQLAGRNSARDAKRFDIQSVSAILRRLDAVATDAAGVGARRVRRRDAAVLSIGALQSVKVSKS